MTLDQPVSGTLAQPGDQAIYRFLGTPGQKVFFDAINPYISNFNAVLTDPFGNNLFSNDAGYDEGPFTLGYGGIYTLTVYGNGPTTGDYAFQLVDDGGTSPISLAPGQNADLSGTLAPGSSGQFYSFHGTAGQRLYVQGGSDSSPNAAFLELYSPYNTNILNRSVENDGEVTLPTDGDYLLAVLGASAGNDTTSYEFQVFANVAPTTTIDVNTIVGGTIVGPGDSASYTFAGTPGQTLFFNGQVPGTAGLSAVLDDPSGHQIFSQGTSSNAGPFVLGTPGLYTVTISGSGRSTGDYQFELLDPSAHPLAAPATVSDTLSPGTEGRAYQFTGTAGQAIDFQSGSFSSTSGTWSIIDPNGHTVASEAFGTDLATTLALSGTYYLLVQGSDTTDPSVDDSFSMSVGTGARRPPAASTRSRAGPSIRARRRRSRSPDRRANRSISMI